MNVKTDTASEKSKDGHEHSRFYELSRKVMLASIGAVTLAQEEVESFVDKLVERGELAESEGKGLIGEMREKRKNRKSKMEEKFNEHVGQTLERFNIPSKDEIDSLNQKIAALNKKLDDLKKSQSS